MLEVGWSLFWFGLVLFQLLHCICEKAFLCIFVTPTLSGPKTLINAKNTNLGFKRKAIFGVRTGKKS